MVSSPLRCYALPALLAASALTLAACSADESESTETPSETPTELDPDMQEGGAVRDDARMDRRGGQ